MTPNLAAGTDNRQRRVGRSHQSINFLDLRVVDPGVTTHRNDAPSWPGWYTTPDDTATERFWNGSNWTDLTRPVPTLAEFLIPVEPLILAILDAYDRNPTVPDSGPHSDAFSTSRV